MVGRVQFMVTSYEKRIRNFVSYAMLNYIEKALVFCFPLSALLFAQDKVLYNKTEYIFAIAAFFAVFIDGGLRVYLLYAYKQSGGRKEKAEEILSVFCFFMRVYLVLFFIFSLGVWFFFPERFVEYSGTAIRALFLATFAFLAVWYRIEDRPATVYFFTIPLYLLGTFLLWLSYSLGELALLVAIVFPHLAFLFFVLAYRSAPHKLEGAIIWQNVMASLKYGWPVLASLMAAMVIANFGKIYAYENLSEEDMFDFSFLQRLALIIQLAHASITGFMAKQMFMNDELHYHVKIFFIYMFVILFACAISFVVLGGGAYFSVGVTVTEANVFLFSLLVAYMVFWCVASYFEIYINKLNKNGFILLGSLLSLGVFLCGLYFLQLGAVFKLAMAMMLSSCFYTIFVFSALYFVRRDK